MAIGCNAHLTKPINREAKELRDSALTRSSASRLACPLAHQLPNLLHDILTQEWFHQDTLDPQRGNMGESLPVQCRRDHQDRCVLVVNRAFQTLDESSTVHVW